MTTALPRLVVILGPTASGKSALGIALAKQLNGEILVCDSTQVYRHFDIGTGKLSAAEQDGIVHHLLDLVEPNEVFTAGEYRKRALDVLEDVLPRKKLPILTAGTGLYLRALLEGLADAPTRSEELRERLRERATRLGPPGLHRLLARIDPESAARIAPGDMPKVIRAIEIRLLARKTVDEVYRGGRAPLQGYEIVKIGLSPARTQLYSRIDARVEEMISAGWPDETRKLIESGVATEAKPFQFIGYSDLRSCIEAGGDPLAARAAIQQATRRFAKRQITWFRRERDVTWLTGFGNDPQIVVEALKLVANIG